MSRAQRYDLAVLGGGAAGLVAAHGAAGLGARVVLIERHRQNGGDRLWSDRRPLDLVKPLLGEVAGQVGGPGGPASTATPALREDGGSADARG